MKTIDNLFSKLKSKTILSRKPMNKMTGKLITMTDEQVETLKTYHEKRSQLQILINHLAAQLEENETKMWLAVRGLYPELHDYDLVIDWEKRQLRVRHMLTSWQKEQLTERET